ncbi:MAG: hypothetical protein J4428_04900 [Candidatus Aenigmarchaeota archaeon]|nr:hypothetical protein [Candidatus Aenigmarchaeota archaeon]
MLNLSNKKAQFFILTSVIIVGIFYTLSKYVNPYSFVDTSTATQGSEIFFFENIKDKTIKTIEISSASQLSSNMNMFRNYVQNIAINKGYTLAYNYNISSTNVNVSMVLSSNKMALRSDFTVPRP